MVQLWLRSIMWQIRKRGSFIWNRANTKFLIWQLPSVNRSILMKHLLRLWSNVTLHRVKNDLPRHCMNFLINIAGSGIIASPALMFSREVATTRCIVRHFVQNWDKKNPTITGFNISLQHTSTWRMKILHPIWLHLKFFWTPPSIRCNVWYLAARQFCGNLILMSHFLSHLFH